MIISTLQQTKHKFVQLFAFDPAVPVSINCLDEPGYFLGVYSDALSRAGEDVDCLLDLG